MVRGAAVPAFKVALAALGLFALAGFGVVRLALPASLRRHELLWVAPVGACVAALELTLLGYAFVPFDVSLGLVIALGVITGAFAVRRRGWPEKPRPIGWTLWPLLVSPVRSAGPSGRSSSPGSSPASCSRHCCAAATPR